MSIFDEGRQAYFNGVDENPYPILSQEWYPILSQEWYEWDEGWEEAEFEDLAQRELEDLDYGDD